MQGGAVRSVAVAAVVVTLVAALPTAAGAARVETWTTTSAYVDPEKEPLADTADGEARAPELRVNVFLPDGYDGRRCFPVLYLMHGGFGGYDYWAHPTKLDVLNVARGFHGIMVMPESGGLGGGIDYWNSGKRGDPGWASYHLSDLIPLAERRLRICPGRENHAIAGYSAGGMTAVLHAAARPGYFGAVASFSGLLAPKRHEFWTAFSAGAAALWPSYFATEPMYRKVWGDPVAQAFYWDGHDPLTLAANLRHTRVFVSHGDGVPRRASDFTHPVKPLEVEAGSMARDFLAAADDAGVTYRHLEHEGVHDYPYFQIAVAEAFTWGFFRDVEERPDSWTYRTVARRGRMWDLSFEFAEPPEVLERFTREGQRLRGEGSGTVTIAASEGCRFTVALPFDVDLRRQCRSEPRPRLQLSVAPTVARTGRRTRFRIRVLADTAAGRRPVDRARVRFANRFTYTDRAGRATITQRFTHAARYRPRASKPGFEAARVAVRVVGKKAGRGR
jgi:S-formylglutathione hydrolase FrmB